jgi:ligand-binding sensor domain-containing protein
MMIINFKNNIRLLPLLILCLFSHSLTADILRNNAIWEVFTNRSSVLAIEPSTENEILWVGTVGGLEQRDLKTGQLMRVWTHLDGLPSNNIRALLADDKGGLWIGMQDAGLAYLTHDQQWQIFNTDNSKLPDESIHVLISDERGGLWIGTDQGGLVHLNASSQWQVFNTDNSDLPHNYVKGLVSDGSGGVWVGGAGIAHLDNRGRGEVFDTDNSGLPLNGILALASDGEGGLWVSTYDIEKGERKYGGLTHFTRSGDWQVFDSGNSDLPDNALYTVVNDGSGGVWMGTVKSGLVHKNNRDQWTHFDPDNSKLPDNTVYSLVADNNANLWVGTDLGLARKNNRNEWLVFNDDNSDLPDNIVQAFITDENGGLWIGTRFGGLTHFSAAGDWESFNTENSALPNNDVNALLNDGNGGLWIGTYGSGLAQRRSTGKWKVFNTLNSDLPKNEINAFVDDGSGGVWIATDEGGLAHLNAAAQWTVFNSDNSDLPNNDVNIVISDGKGGLWIGTNEGLAHLNARSQWQVFNMANSDLPANQIVALANDEKGGLWVGTYKGGLAHFNGSSQWHIFNTSNSDLPDDTVVGLVPEKEGVWVATLRGGLTYKNNRGKWTTFNTDNSDIPTNVLLSLISDGSHGLWIGMSWGGGLAHLNFGNPLSGKRAAILIHPKLRSRSPKKHFLNKNIVGYIYQALSERYYTHEEIYFLSYDVLDVNRDGITDRQVVDALKNRDQMNLEDIRQAFNWAKTQGRLNEPLLVTIVAENLDGQLLLNPEPMLSLSGADLKNILDDYQQSTSNEVIVVIESSRAGQLIPQLKNEAYQRKRIIITSTDADKPTQHQDILGKDAFSWGYFNALRRGSSFGEAFDNNRENAQKPQLDDDGDGKSNTNRGDGKLAKRFCLNGCFAPSAGKTTYRNGDTLQITLKKELLREHKKNAYVAIGLPNGGPLFILTQQNELVPFEETNLSAWEGEDVVVELPVSPDWPRGEYSLYLLRVKKGLEPLKHRDEWELNLGSVLIE